MDPKLPETLVAGLSDRNQRSRARLQESAEEA